MLFLDGVSVERPNGCLRFRWVNAPTSAELMRLADTAARRIGRYLELQGLLERVRPIKTGIGPVDRAAIMEVTWYTRRLKRMGRGQEPRPNESGLKAFALSLVDSGVGMRRTRRLRAA